MKKRLVFVSLILFSVILLSLMVSAENSANSSNIKTETITCVFNNLDKEEKCASYFNSNPNYFDFPSNKFNSNFTPQQYSCIGKGNCSVIVGGERGSIIKMRPMKWCDITDGKAPSAPGKTIIVDGTDKIIQFDCIKRAFFPSLLDTLNRIFTNLYSQNKIGYRYAYYLCSDGSEGLFNTSGECTPLSEGRSKVDELCDNNMNAAAFDNCIV